MHLATHTVGTQGSLEWVGGNAGSESGDPTTSLPSFSYFCPASQVPLLELRSDATSLQIV